LCLYAKRLERGRFVWPLTQEGAVVLTPAQLSMKEALLSQREQLIAEKEALLAERDRLIAVRDAELYSKTLQIEHLKAQLAVLRRARFGRSSEKLDRDIEQLELLIGELEEGVAENKIRAEQAEDKARATATRAIPTNPQAGGRKPLPAHLPRERIVHEPAPACACCGSTVLRKLGEDVTELLEYVPSSFKVIQLVRPKLSCRACETIVQAPLPSLPIERGRPGPGLLAHVAVAKYADGLPLYRQSAIYAREGIDLDRSTLADWVGRMAGLLDPLVQAIGRHVCAGSVLHADDTTVEVLAPGQGPHQDRAIMGGGTRRARIWRSNGARCILPLLARSARRTCRGAARQLPRLPARRRLCGLQQPVCGGSEERAAAPHRSSVLGTCASQHLRGL
jgi:transposase